MGRPPADASLEEQSEREKPEKEDRTYNEGQGDESGGDCVSDDDDGSDCFFESLDRVPSGVSFGLDLPSSGSDSDEDDVHDVRVSFASAVDAPRFSICVADLDDYFPIDDGDASTAGGDFDYGLWLADSVSLNERRRRLLQGMGLASSSRHLAPSRNRRCTAETKSLAATSASTRSYRFPPPLPSSAATNAAPSTRSPVLPPSPSAPAITRSRSLSDSHLLFQSPPSSLLLRSLSWSPSQLVHQREGNKGGGFGMNNGEVKGKSAGDREGGGGEAGVGAYKIKNLDTGKEFVVSEVGKDGTCGRLNDVQTGVQLTMDEFERFLGLSPIVKELMRRVNIGGEDKKKSGGIGGNSNSNHHCYGGKGSKSGRRKRGSWLKNIKFVASSVTGLISEKERDNATSSSASGRSLPSNANSDWLKVHKHGKSYKELTGLYMSQEIQAHQGSIWCMRFSSDGRFLASAGEDRTVHVWQVMESETFSTFSLLRHQVSHLLPNMSSAAANGSSSRMDQAAILGARMSKRRKGSKLGTSKHFLPDYVVLPETIFSLSEKAVCSFEGHLDDVLDLSWSKSPHLLSSSMDKTVRLWDIESKACLKLFVHNDYVTCIQFNPIDENYFISGSLDAKVRIWSIPDRQVVDWSGLHEMVTAVCYTPDGQGALVGSHKGSFRFYNTFDDKLSQEGQIDICNKKRKSHAKKITGFQYAPDNPSEVMVTSADSQIRVYDGVDIIHKFRGFRNTSSQMSASFTADGNYVVCASEDSHVYIWKRDSARGGGKNKGWVTTRSHEYFYCKDVSVAIPWPNTGSNCEKPTMPFTVSGNLGASSRSQQSTSNLDDPFLSGRSQCPVPHPPRSGSKEQPLSTSPDSLRARSPRLASALGRSSLQSSVNSTSSSSFASWGWGSSSNRAVTSSPVSANAWGLVVVTAGLGGNISIYQNFGLPVRLSKQTNLF